MADTPGTTDDDAKDFARWLAEVEYAQKDETYKRWINRSELIVKRYRDDRKSSTAEMGKRRYNILWSNVQTMGPAIYGKMPKPIVERRFLDRDPGARLASLMLERTLAFQMDICGYHDATGSAVLDYLLPGMGQVWLRYSPEFESEKLLSENEAEEYNEEADETAADEEDEGDGTPTEKLSFERICFDYVFYRDFLWGPARKWTEVPWVAKRSWLDKSEAVEAFGKDIADVMVFGDPKNKTWATATAAEPMQLGKSKKAEVWEIWNKANRCVYFIAPDTVGVMLKREEDDPLKLEEFWPCPPPLFATQTNDTLIPVPDYVEYQDQAAELDTLTQRIAVVTTAIRANGVYDSSFPALQRLFQDGQDNKLIPVDQWAAFAEKGGMPGALSLVPMDMLIKVLTELYAARDKVKEDIYEITGMSDIIRGATDPNETMGAQKIKARFATGRLGSRQQSVAEFCANIVRIAAEIVSEVFSPESLKLMSGIDQMGQEAVKKAVEGVQPPPNPQAPQGQQVPPQAMQQWQQQFDQMKRQAAMQAQQVQAQQFDAAMKLLRNDKLRGFRVDIETDSTIADDMGQDRSEATTFVSSVLQALESAAPIIASAPEMARPICEMLMWAMRKFRVGRVLEATFELAMDDLEKRIEAMKNAPPQPDPEQIKAQATMQVAQAKAQSEQISSQAEQARSQSDLQIAQAKFAGEQQAAALQQKIDGLTLQLDAAKAAAANDTSMKLAKLDFMKSIMVAQIAAGQETDAAELDAQIEVTLGFAKMQHEKDMQAGDQAHQAGMQDSQQQADAAQADGEAKPAKGKKAAVAPAASLAQNRHDAMLAQMQQNHEAVANALGQVGQGMQAIAKAHAAPKRVVRDANGRPAGIETVGG